MNEHLNLDATRQLLNRSLGQLDPTTLAALRKAREQALLRHAPGGARGGWMLGARRHAAALVATLFVVIGAAGGATYYWQQLRDNSETDLAILTDDLPADVYVN